MGFGNGGNGSLRCDYLAYLEFPPDTAIDKLMKRNRKMADSTWVRPWTLKMLWIAMTTFSPASMTVRWTSFQHPSDRPARVRARLNKVYCKCFYMDRVSIESGCGDWWLMLRYVKCHRMSMWYHSFPGTQQTLTNGVASWQQTDPTGTVAKGIVILLMAEILHQLRLVVYPIIYRVLYIIPGAAGFLPSTVLTPKYAC